MASLLIYKAAQKLTGRLRPCDQFTDVGRHAPMLDMYSFPSGHDNAVGFTAVLLGHFPAFGVLITPSSFSSRHRVSCWACTIQATWSSER